MRSSGATFMKLGFARTTYSTRIVLTFANNPAESNSVDTQDQDSDYISEAAEVCGEQINKYSTASLEVIKGMFTLICIWIVFINRR